MMYLKQSTASQTVLIGPFIDDTDGKTAETGLTIANTDIRLSKNGANIVAKNSGGGTHDEIGYYQITLDATDTDTVGKLQVMVDATGALPVYHEFHVLEEAIYDALIGASATGFDSNGRVDVALIEGVDATDQINAACDTAIETYGLDHLVSASVTGTDVADNSIIAQMVDDGVTADWDNYDNATASLEALNVDTDAIKAETDKLDSAHSEPTGVPAANETPLDKLAYVFMALRNKVTITSSKKQFFDDGGTAEWEKDLADNGTEYSESEGNAP